MYFPKSIASQLKFATQSRCQMVGFGGHSPSETKIQVLPIEIWCTIKQ